VFIVNPDGLDTNAFSLKGDSDISVKCTVEPWLSGLTTQVPVLQECL